MVKGHNLKHQINPTKVNGMSQTLLNKIRKQCGPIGADYALIRYYDGTTWEYIGQIVSVYFMKEENGKLFEVGHWPILQITEFYMGLRYAQNIELVPYHRRWGFHLVENYIKILM